MIERTNLLTLREIVSEYPVVLMDSSALYNTPFREKKYNSLEERKAHIQEQQKFLDVLICYIKEEMPFFITNLVSGESENRHCPYKKLIKRKSVQENRELLYFVRRVRALQKEGKKLISLLEEKNRILELDENEKRLYNSLCNTRYGAACSELGDVDSDFLISGAVVLQTRGKTCLVSNDFGMFHLWKNFLDSRKMNKEYFGFAVRVEADSFKILDNRHIPNN